MYTKLYQVFDNIGDVSSTGILVPSCVETGSLFTVENKGIPNNSDKGDVQLTRRGTCFLTKQVPNTCRYRTCRAQIQSDLVESYGFLTNQLVMSKLSTNVHYSKMKVCLSDILT